MQREIHGGNVYGREVRLDFSVNINPLGMPQGVRQAITEYTAWDETYPDIECTDLRRAIAQKEGIAPEQILCGNGASELLMAVVRAAAPEKRLKEKERLAAKKKAKVLTKEAQENIAVLENCMQYLNKNEELSIALSAGAKRKRVYDRSNPAYKWVALSITLLGAAALLYGIYALITHAGFAMYFLLFGLASIFFFSSANVLPTARNNKKYIETHLEQAVDEMQQYIRQYPDFPVPAWYAHPVVLKRMIDIMQEGRATTIEKALEVLKSDLKALNSSVAVEQEEYDEVMAIKPLFLIREYQ